MIRSAFFPLVVIVAVAVVAGVGLKTYRNQRPAERFREGSPTVSGNMKSPVIVELFTSEGCSSCPPADAILAQLEQTQPVPGVEIIALSEHVDYWNYIGWADPFSSPVFGERQNTYAGSIGGANIYTPQMVVDGRVEFVGSKLNRALDAVASVAHLPKAKVELSSKREERDATITLKAQATGIPAQAAAESLDLFLAITESELHSNVGRGENAGRKLSHTAVVRQLTLLVSGRPNSIEPLIGETSFKTPTGWNPDHLRAVAFLQERATRKIIGAATLKI